MASTWSALKVELLETGANAGSWGTLTNANLGDAVLGEAITGQATVDFATDADVTITLTDSASTQAARNLRLNITESSSGVGSVRNLILGSGCQIEKFYLINNTGTGAKTVKNTSGTGISVPAGKATLVYNNGTNVVDAASYFTSLTLGSPLPIASGGTATATPALVQGSGVTITGTWPNQTINATGTGGTVTSVAVSGGTTGLTTSGGPITTSGTITLAGTVATTNGGTGLTSFTSGGVVYASSTSALATGSALTFDGTNLGVNGRFVIDGIVASAPANGGMFRLSNESNYFTGKTTGSGGAVLSNGDGTATIQLYKNSPTSYMVFEAGNGTEGMRLTSTGLGIGTSSPISGYLLTVNGQGAFTGPTSDVDGNGGVRINYGNASGAIDRFLTLNANGTTNAAIGLNMVDSSTGSMTFSTRIGNALGVKATLTSGGNLLIGGTAVRGTTAGSAHLDLFNSTAPAGTLTNGISLYSDSGDLKFMNAAGDAFDVGYRNIPQNSQSAAYTLVLADAGKHIFHPVGDNNARTFTIPANSSVAYPVGTAITFINMAAANVTIAITSDTMYLSSAGTTGSRTLAQYGSATAIKITSTNWLISGSGLT